MTDFSKLPILDHFIDEPSTFTAQALIESVRRMRQLRAEATPPLCVLEFDGDLTDWLVEGGLARPFPSWPCFHTTMLVLELEGLACGIIPRTIGGPYAVLIAEQLACFRNQGDYWPDIGGAGRSRTPPPRSGGCHQCDSRRRHLVSLPAACRRSGLPFETPAFDRE